MNSNGTWNTGENILLRGVWRKRLWLAAPATVVQDNSNLIAIYWKADTPSKIPPQRITYKELLSNEQIHLVDSKWVTTDVLRECLKTSQNRGSRANLQDDQIRANLPDRPE